MNQEQLKENLLSNQIKQVILDTDTFNEVDDQFALAYAMLSKDHIHLLSVNAAPFFNERSVSPKDGMEKSYREIKEIMRLTDPTAKIPYFKGSPAFFGTDRVPVPSDAADSLCKTVMESQNPVFIVSIGALTNVASALLQCPSIAQKAVVIWLGGHALTWPHTREFNLKQDPIAAQIVMDSQIPLLQIPCCGVCTELLTSLPELQAYLAEKNPLCDYLIRIVREYSQGRYAWSKVIWDISAIAALTVPTALETVLIPRPIIGSDLRYSFDAARHPYLYTRRLRRDAIYGDLFRTLEKAWKGEAVL